MSWRSGKIQICRKCTGAGFEGIELARGSSPVPADMRCTWPGRITAAVAEAVLVLECAFEHVGDDLHVAVRCAFPESPARLHPILVDHPKRSEAHVARGSW